MLDLVLAVKLCSADFGGNAGAPTVTWLCLNNARANQIEDFRFFFIKDEMREEFAFMPSQRFLIVASISLVCQVGFPRKRTDHDAVRRAPAAAGAVLSSAFEPRQRYFGA